MNAPPDPDAGGPPPGRDPMRRPDRTWLWVALAFVAAFALFRWSYGPSGRGPSAVRPEDYRWRLVTLDGQPRSFESYRGKPVFLNLWATWCPPCVSEMPSIARLARNPRLEGVAFLCVSLDEFPDAPREFARAHDLPMTVLMPAEEVPATFATQGIPATFLIAPDGRIVRREVGSMEWDRPEVVAQLESLARASPR